MAPFYSIIVPVYNGEKYIYRCISSVIQQRFSDWELIIIDNNSEDDTKKIVEIFSDDRIRLLTINNDGVIAKSRNKGIDYSKGKYVCFLDADDWWKEEKLEVCKKNIDLGYNFIYHDLELFRDKGNRLFQSKVVRGRTLNNYPCKDMLLNGNPIKTSSVCVKKEFLQDCRFDESQDLAGVEDFDLWLSLSLCVKEISYLYLSDILGYYYLGNTFSQSMKQIEQEKHLLHKYWNLLDAKERKEAVLVVLFHKACFLYSIQDYNAAIKYFNLAKKSPSVIIKRVADIAVVKSFVLAFFNDFKKT